MGLNWFGWNLMELILDTPKRCRKRGKFGFCIMGIAKEDKWGPMSSSTRVFNFIDSRLINDRMIDDHSQKRNLSLVIWSLIERLSKEPKTPILKWIRSKRSGDGSWRSGQKARNTKGCNDWVVNLTKHERPQTFTDLFLSVFQFLYLILQSLVCPFCMSYLRNC